MKIWIFNFLILSVLVQYSAFAGYPGYSEFRFKPEETFLNPEQKGDKIIFRSTGTENYLEQLAHVITQILNQSDVYVQSSTGPGGNAEESSAGISIGNRMTAELMTSSTESPDISKFTETLFIAVKIDTTQYTLFSHWYDESNPKTKTTRHEISKLYLFRSGKEVYKMLRRDGFTEISSMPNEMHQFTKATIKYLLAQGFELGQEVYLKNDDDYISYFPGLTLEIKENDLKQLLSKNKPGENRQKNTGPGDKALYDKMMKQFKKEFAE